MRNKLNIRFRLEILRLWTHPWMRRSDAIFPQSPSLRASADCACAALYAVVRRCWAAAGCSWLHVVHPGHAVDHVCAWFGLLRSRSRRVMSRRSACYMACPARGRVDGGARSTIPATRAAVAPLARAAAAVARRLVGAVPAACGLGVARDVRVRLFVCRMMCTNETVSMSYETENVHSLPTAAPAHP